MTEDEVASPGPAVFPHPPPAPSLTTGDLLAGAPELAAPTVDSDADGVADTTVAPWGDGLVLATDLDRDGHADVVTRVGPEGVVTTRHGDVEERPWGAPPPPPPSIDPRTGAWVRG
ncbi:DUF6802 family protein [Actinomycetospora soli]|uniref:DUF6802 family protein n=1 Tax=Actinomycetospora soli TaxID=2893887 RepID=UPI001E5CC2F4|nr:DUF6802 family protein [Actinomycetospora soli]MCD2186298.1 hypothetical protein [Actinomycetospora soli]